MSLAVITLSTRGVRMARQLAETLHPLDVYAHRDVAQADQTPFDRVVDLTARIFTRYRGLVYILPSGVAVRAIAPLLQDKRSDPAVVTVDVGGRWAVSLLGGHERGANRLAVDVANALGAEPVISTTTEAVKSVIVGVGCRKGIAADHIETSIRAALETAGASLDDVRLLATADVKRREPGLLEAAGRLNVPLRVISSEEIRRCERSFVRSSFVQEKVGLPAVAEPAALLAARRTQLLLPRQTYNGVTIALARENSTWLE